MLAPALIVLLFATPPAPDTGLSRFLEPVLDGGHSLVVSRAGASAVIQGARAAIILLDTSFDASTEESIDWETFHLPFIRGHRWGYEDEIVFGSIEGRGVGLRYAPHRTVSDPNAVIDHFDDWVNPLTANAVPDFSAWKSITLRGNAWCSLPRSLAIVRSLELLIPSMFEGIAEASSDEDHYSVRAVAMVATARGPVVARVILTVGPRPDQRPVDDYHVDASTPELNSLSFTTRRFLVRVELSPSFSMTDRMSAWREPITLLLETP